LLARAGIDVLVLEKHADFLRDFRGDTIHPSTLELMSELGLLDDLLELPHQTVSRISFIFGTSPISIADFRHLPAKCGFVAFMPQWNFLSFLSEHASAYPTFALQMETEVTELIEQEERVVGVRAQTPEGPIEVYADLTVAADGRHSVLRERSGLRVRDFGAPMDVLWFKLDRRPDQTEEPLGRFGAGQILILINRGSYWQCGYIIPKGALDEMRKSGLEVFRSRISRLAPFLRDQLTDLDSWDDIKLLTVQVNRMNEWCRPGLLFIGDAAHAMSPIAGVGINLAIQDAVAAANLLAAPLADSGVQVEHLQRVQRRREWPTVLTQRLQLLIQNRIISVVLDERKEVKPPMFFRLLERFPVLQRIPGRLFGLGVRPEHLATPMAEREH
jgi:2-polyprenyl-6-methoxyphenol hydroxylase-like FAD-dependent oxidoreductase